MASSIYSLELLGELQGLDRFLLGVEDVKPLYSVWAIKYVNQNKGTQRINQ